MDATVPSRLTNQDALPGPTNRMLAIFLVSVVGLFLEMLLIRWIGTEIRIFAYLQNTVLVVCFLGLGMGCFTCRQPIRINRTLVSLLLLTTILAIPATRLWAAHISRLLSVLEDLLIWQRGSAATTWQVVWQLTVGLAMTFGLMVLLWEMFVPLGRLLGRLMDDCPHTIRAYSVNVAGSLLGIWLFVGLSAWNMPPVVWFATVGLLLWAFINRGERRKAQYALLGGILVTAWLAGRDPAALEVVWSPYQKLDLRTFDNPQIAWSGDYVISVNNAGYQGIIDLSPEKLAREPRIPANRHGLSQYDVPLLLHPHPERVLIVGSGSGNDVAGALRGGAREVTAVEIDPAIIEMGRKYHPERPYDSERVRVVADDARSFFAATQEKFDLIIFGLLDSHTTTAMTNARLDHYVYTRESLQKAKSLLAEGGVVALSFEAEKPYIADRMSGCLREVFGATPTMFRIPSDASGWGGVMFVAGEPEQLAQQLDRHAVLADHIARWQAEYPIQPSSTAEVTTDDWPYIYLESRRIPTLYYLLAGLMLGLVYYCKRRLKQPGLLTGWTKSHWHFFFLGAAFLLLEVQNISKASVALGNTWWVNAVIISGILMMILLANLIVARLPRLSETAAAVCLIGSCLGLYLVDISQFASLPLATRSLVVGALTTLPMLFSGIIFMRSFARVERKDLALGANLVGALVGGLLQSVTFVTGIKALLLIVAGLYACALLCRPSDAASDTPDEADDSRRSLSEDSEEPTERCLEPVAV